MEGEIIWEDKDGDEYTSEQITDSHLKKILKMFDCQEVYHQRGEMLNNLKALAKKRGLNIECDFTEVETDRNQDGTDKWAEMF